MYFSELDIHHFILFSLLTLLKFAPTKNDNVTIYARKLFIQNIKSKSLSGTKTNL